MILYVLDSSYRKIIRRCFYFLYLLLSNQRNRKEPQIPVNKTVGISWLFNNFLTLIEYHDNHNTDIATMFEHLVNIGILEQTNLFSFVSAIIVIINLTKFVLSIYLVHFIFIQEIQSFTNISMSLSNIRCAVTNLFGYYL